MYRIAGSVFVSSVVSIKSRALRKSRLFEWSTCTGTKILVEWENKIISYQIPRRGEDLLTFSWIYMLSTNVINSVFPHIRTSPESFIWNMNRLCVANIFRLKWQTREFSSDCSMKTRSSSDRLLKTRLSRLHLRMFIALKMTISLPSQNYRILIEFLNVTFCNKMLEML